VRNLHSVKVAHRRSGHFITNTGDVDTEMFWVFMSPGLEHWFCAIGQKCEPGDGDFVVEAVSIAKAIANATGTFITRLPFADQLKNA
jgi:hypothetical protein